MTRRDLSLRPGTGALLLALANLSTAQTVQDTTTSYQYDANGNLTQITDPLGRVTNQSFDALNRLTQQLQPAPVAGGTRPAISYSYDGLNQLTKVTDPRNLATSYTIDSLGNRTALTSPDTGTTTSTYDAAGNLKTSKDAKGQITIYQYDVLNRLTQITYADNSTIAYTYDQGANGLGRLTQIADVSGTTQYTYDPQGRITAETRTINNTAYVTGYNYSSGGRLAGITYPSGRTVSYMRDGAGRISQIDVSKGQTTQTVVSQIRYQPFGGVQSFVNGAGQMITRSYDLDNRIASYTLRGQPQLIRYDAASRIQFIADAAAQGITTNYGYDNLDRLISLQRPDSSLGYGYDAAGNRISQTNNANVTTYSYASDSNRLTQIAGNQTVVIGMDANGSITNNSMAQFNYDARSRLVSANTALGPVQYRINALGQRVQKIAPGGSTVFHYDTGGRLIGESGDAGSKDYVYLDDLPVAILTP